MVQQVMLSAIIHIIWSLWLERNNRYFNDQRAPTGNIINRVISKVHLSFRLALVKGSSAMTDFRVVHLFNIPLRPSRAVPDREVSWTPPTSGCIKINVDGSAFGSPSSGTIGIVFRDWHNSFVGAFTHNIGYATALEAEFSAFMYALEKAVDLGYHNIWIECDSFTVAKAFRSDEGIP